MIRKFLSVLTIVAIASSFVLADPASPTKRGKGYKQPSAEVRAKLHAEAFKRHGFRMHYFVKNATPPAKFDCRDMGWVPPVDDQGQCGDCFGVSTSDLCTMAFIKAGYQKADGSFHISTQYGLDCGAYDGGCNGGNGEQVADWMKKTGFPADRYVDDSGKSASDYPAYTASAGQCRLPSGAKMWKIADWGYATSDQSDRAATPAEIKAAMMQYGPLSIALDASDGCFDGSGDVCEDIGTNVDHEITMVAWDDSKGKAGAFLVRNQWSKDWGDQGYRWIGYGTFKNVVSVFWMTVTPQPAPPPPPGPTPGTATLTSVTATFSDGSTQTLGGTGLTADQLKAMTIPQLMDFINAGKSKPPCPKPMPPAEGGMSYLDRKIAEAYAAETAEGKAEKAMAISRQCWGAAARILQDDWTKSIGEFRKLVDGYYDPLPKLKVAIVSYLDALIESDREWTSARRSLASTAMQSVASGIDKAVKAPAVGERKSWSQLMLPKGAEKYQSAEFTQAVSHDRSNAPAIRRVPIKEVDRKWQQSGGMDGVAGVTSDKYRSLPRAPEEFVGKVAVTFKHEGREYEQEELALRRRYADGSRFDDVLSYNGVVFEHRKREKVGGKWTSGIVYSDAGARPPGYEGLTTTCAECHEKAGTGIYAMGLAPGGDGVLSDPLPWRLWKK